MPVRDIPSSDAKNISCRAILDGDEWLINGEKFYISGAGDPRCKIMICMVQTNPDGPPHKRQSQSLVPMDNPGVEILKCFFSINYKFILLPKIFFETKYN